MNDGVIIAIVSFAAGVVALGLVILAFGNVIGRHIMSGGYFSGLIEISKLFKASGTFGRQEGELKESEKKELKESSQRWNRNNVGNIYWIASDLTRAAPISMQFPPDTVKHYVRQCYWHASQLALGNPIEGRLKQLCSQTALYTVDDWNNPDRRSELANELSGLLTAIGFIMEEGDFKSNPPDDWFHC
jgi:hypothetical protein